MRYIKYFTIIIAVFFVFYLFGAFILWEFNPELWDRGGRLLLVMFGAIISPFVASYALDRS